MSVVQDWVQPKFMSGLSLTSMHWNSHLELELGLSYIRLIFCCLSLYAISSFCYWPALQGKLDLKRVPWWLRADWNLDSLAFGLTPFSLYHADFSSQELL